MQDKDIDTLLALAARQGPPAAPVLMDRVLADALALQPKPVAPGRRGWLHRLADLFGGGPVLAGMCGAAMAGLALGYLAPVSLELVTGGLSGTEDRVLDLFPATDFLNGEG